jgi:hypothetical protein
MRRIVALAAFAGAVTTAACDGVGQAMSSHTGVVARAAGHEFTVEEAVRLLEPHQEIAGQPGLVEAVANLWVDYVLLATAVNRDTTLATVDVESLLRPFIEHQEIMKLRERVIAVDTAISDEDLRAQYEREQPNVEIRARHILLRLAPDATPAQRDSVLAHARSIREQAAGGADFAQLAREHGQDPSAQQGGDLGFFGRNEMVEPFENAAFALQPGGVSDVVESPFGLHVIKVEERRQPPFEEVRDDFRSMVVGTREFEAEEQYLSSLLEPRRIEVQDGAVDAAREIARKMRPIASRQGARVLVRYQGGTLTAAEFMSAMESWPQDQRERLATLPDDNVEQVLEGLTRQEILVAEARAQGLSLTPVEQDSLRREAREQLLQAAQMTGLSGIRPQAGETLAQAIERRVEEFLQAILRGEQAPLPLGPLGYSLRAQMGGSVNDREFQAVVNRVQAGRSAQPMPQQPMPQQPPQPQPPPPPPQPDGNR